MPILSVLLGLWTAATPAKPSIRWGDDGHMIVCQMAFDLLDDALQDEVLRLTRLYKQPDSSRYNSFAVACTYPDKARNMARANVAGWDFFSRFDRWHFLNVPRDTREIRAEHCGANCVLRGIAYHQARLANTSLEDWKRSEAMIFLGHWVGDLHQPLHVSYADDNGGNDISTSGLYNRTMHSVWDTGILRRDRGSVSWRVFADQLDNSLPGSNSSDPLVWAQESYDLTVSSGVRYCRWRTTEDGEACTRLGSHRTLNVSYQNAFEDDVRRRLQLAAVRLAALLEAALSSTSP